jgi:hypothetical protein
MPTGVGFTSFEKELNRLVGIFERNLAEFKKPGYVEAQLRDDFLNPFFRALGWDLENRAGLIQSEREVEIESRTRIQGRQKRADYLFRADKRDRFVCEAKKPSEELQSRYAFQAKRYAWNKGLPLAILTDFGEMKIYVVGGRPYIDEPHVGEWKTYHFKQYPLVAQELWNLLARDKVSGGSIDQLIESLPKKPAVKGKARQQWLIKPDRSRALDVNFLEFLEEARRELAQDLLKQNDRDELLVENKLNEAVQRILDRILFLRICEDRDIDTGALLQSIVETWRKNYGKEEGRRAYQHPLELHEAPPADFGTSGIHAPKDSLWHAVVRHFRALDRRPPSHVPFFNGNLFKPHFSESLVVGDEWLAGFIGDLSDDESPYLFNVIPVEILGSVYERFLGNVLRLRGRGVELEPKPEVRKAGGVYYTPPYIVDYIVEQTVGKLLHDISGGGGAGSAPSRRSRPSATVALKDFEKETAALRLLDPACGSGSFLIRAFERVCEHWQRRLTADLPPRKKADERAAWEKKHRELCWVDADTGDVHLTVNLKRQVLTQNIYGVDLDAAAVEVTQLSLYLKMLENENRTTLARERELFAEAVALLPPLQDNIKCGNSLIASDFSMIPEDLVRVHAFDWPVQFASVMKAGGFDAVIGNPPYGATLDEQSKNYIAQKFASYRYKYDSYIYFVEQAICLIRDGGFAPYITPELWLKLESAESLRKLIRDKSELVSVRICGENVFEDAVVNTVVFVLRRGFATRQIRIIEANGSWLMPDSVWSASDGLAIDYRLHPEIRAVMQRFKNSNVIPLSSFGTAIQGITPYDKYSGQSVDIIKRRGYHFTHKKDKTCGKWLAGEDIDRYMSSWSGEWLSYGPWLGAPREPRFFTGPRLLFREIPGNERRIQATFVEKETLYHGHSITPFKANEGKSTVNILYLLGLSNSKLLSWYGGLVLPNFGKSIFPKLNPQDIKALPIRAIDFSQPADKSRHDKLVGLVDKMLGLTPKLRAATSEAGHATLQNAVTATDRQIDQLVYELYGLTKEEIQLVENGE